MSDLPEPAHVMWQYGKEIRYYSAEQLRDVARAATQSERERCAEIAEGFDACDTKHIADAIRRGK